MIFQRLRVFISSKMQELAPERKALKAALDALRVDAWVFEEILAHANIHLLKAAVRSNGKAEKFDCDFLRLDALRGLQVLGSLPNSIRLVRIEFRYVGGLNPRVVRFVPPEWFNMLCF